MNTTSQKQLTTFKSDIAGLNISWILLKFHLASDNAEEPRSIPQRIVGEDC